MEERERTLAKAVTLEGIGVHSGRPARVTLSPGAPGTGICFSRGDLPGEPRVPVCPAAIHSSDRSTSLASQGARVVTVEHLLAGLFWMGVDNAVVTVSGEEIPVLDGSALPVARAVEATGVVEQESIRKIITVSQSVGVEAGESLLVALPSDAFKIRCVIDFQHPLIGTQSISCEISPEVFLNEIAPARTFGFLREREELQRRGLALGAGPENTLILTEDGLWEGTLRFKDEFVRHKVLDVLGDLVLLGKRIKGQIIAFRPSHQLNAELVRRLYAVLG